MKKIATLLSLLPILFSLLTHSSPAKACDYGYNGYEGNQWYDLPAATYDQKYFYSPSYYDTSGYDNWWYRLWGRNTQYYDMRIINDSCAPQTSYAYPQSGSYCCDAYNSNQYGSYPYYDGSSGSYYYDPYYDQGSNCYYGYQNSNCSSPSSSYYNYNNCCPTSYNNTYPYTTPAPYSNYVYPQPNDGRSFQGRYYDGAREVIIWCIKIEQNSPEYRNYQNLPNYGNGYGLLICRTQN